MGSWSLDFHRRSIAGCLHSEGNVPVGSRRGVVGRGGAAEGLERWTGQVQEPWLSAWCFSSRVQVLPGE